MGEMLKAYCCADIAASGGTAAGGYIAPTSPKKVVTRCVQDITPRHAANLLHAFARARLSEFGWIAR